MMQNRKPKFHIVPKTITPKSVENRYICYFFMERDFWYSFEHFSKNKLAIVNQIDLEITTYL